MNNEPWLNVKCFLLDMDGTLNELHMDCLFLTNNSSQHLRQYAEKITRLGLPLKKKSLHPGKPRRCISSRKARHYHLSGAKW